EAVRRLRTNLQYANLSDQNSSFLVTSSISGEGKSMTSVNLAIALADTGARTVLVDADLRRPSVADYLGLEGEAGLTTVLVGRAELGDVLQEWSEGGIAVLAAGHLPPNPAEMLGSREMSELLSELTASYDAVVIDSPPLLPVTDAALLSKLVSGTLLLAGTDRVRKAELTASLEALDAVDARILGIVLNRVERKHRSYDDGTYT
ncbi:CpsD/CapB family tyrosine-protein kinase, partial [Georgenia sp. 10Sc9-8]|nr:CpsD/CapB family tyrosine-protein kinase [Georgenia halotolerans]